MPDDIFNMHKKTLAVELLKKPENLMEQAAVYQEEIDTCNYVFDRSQNVEAELQSILINDIIDFYTVSYFSILLI